MDLSFTIVLPFFALVLTGYGAVRWGVLEQSVIPGLNKFVYYFALPALLFAETAAAPLKVLTENAMFVVAYGMAALSVFAFAAFGAKILFSAPPRHAALMGLGGCYGNLGFMGLPLLIAAVGSWSAIPVALMLLFDIAVLIPLVTTIMSLNDPDNTHARFMSTFAASVLKNPLVIAIAAGFAMALMDWNLPGPVDTFTGLLGRAAGPVAMFTLGAVLAGQPLSDGLGEAVFVAVFKLALYPALIWASMSVFGISGDWRLAATLAGALPVAAVFFVIAERHKAMPARASTTVLVTTAISMATLTALIAWLV